MKAANNHTGNQNDIFTPKIADLMQKYKDWISISKINLFAPLFSLTSFFMCRVIVQDDEKKITHPITSQVEIITYPGCKKISIFKLHY